MKTLRTGLLFLSISLLCSCSKEGIDRSVQGKWQLAQVYLYDIYGSGAQWTDADSSYKEFLVFAPDQSFAKSTVSSSGMQTFSGKYSFPGNGALTLDLQGYTGPYSVPMRLERNSLELTDPLRCGYIIRRYKRIE